jgi:hypothetical protein
MASTSAREERQGSMEKKALKCDVCAEVLDELSIVRFTDLAQLRVLPPGTRECDRASRIGDWKHLQRCPDCLDNAAENIVMDAESHRADGNVEDANILEVKAAELCLRAIRLRAAAK